MVTIKFLARDDLAQKIDQAAAADDRSRASWLRRVAAQALELSCAKCGIKRKDHHRRHPFQEQLS